MRYWKVKLKEALVTVMYVSLGEVFDWDFMRGEIQGCAQVAGSDFPQCESIGERFYLKLIRYDQLYSRENLESSHAQPGRWLSC